MIVLLVIGGLATVAAAPMLFLWSRRRAGGTTTRTSRPGRGIFNRAGQRGRERRDERRMGYRYADDRLFVQGNGVFTTLILATAGDDLTTDDEAGEIALRPVGLYSDLVKIFDGKTVQCMESVRYRTATAQEWLRQLLANAWDPTDLYKALAAKVARHIEGSTPQRFWTLQVRLGDLPTAEETNPYAAISGELTGVAEENITPKLLAPWWEKADQVHRVAALHGAEPISRRDLIWSIRKPLHGHLPVPEVTQVRRRPWKGGFFELAAVLRGSNEGGGVIKLIQRNPESGEDAVSYTATLVVVDQPPRQVFNPRNPWAKRLAALSFPVEIIWRYSLIPGKSWKDNLKGFITNVDDEAEDRAAAGAGSDPAFDARLAQVEELRDNLAEDPPPGMVGRLRLSVSAPTLRALGKAIDDIKSAMGDVEVEVSEHAALLLLEEQLPGETLPVHMGSLSAGAAGGLALWLRHSDTYQPALGMLGAYSQVGDRVQMFRGRLLGWIGMVIGYIKSNGVVVHFDPFAQLARNGGAGVAILGASGGGKTSLALALFFWLSESGARIGVLDPKIDFRNFILYLCFGPQVLEEGFFDAADEGTVGTPGSPWQPVNRQLWDDTDIFDLARGVRGIRDPWRIKKNFVEAYNLALVIIDTLFANDELRRIAKRGLREMFNDYKAAAARGEEFRCGLGDLITYIDRERQELLADKDAAKTAGASTSDLRKDLDLVEEVCNRLENGETKPFLRILLGKGTDSAAVLHARGAVKRRTIYTLSGFRPPENPDPADWNDDERDAAAAMLVVLDERYAQLDGRMVRKPGTDTMMVPPSGTIIDEGSMVTGQRAGRGYIRKGLKQGRSLQHFLMLLDQRTKGLSQIEEEARTEDGEEVNQFPTLALFRQKKLGEAKLGLNVLRDAGDDLPTAQQNSMARKLIEPNLLPGECYFRDASSQVAPVVVDQLFWPLQRASQTNQSLVAVDWSYDVPTDPAGWEINPEALEAVRTAVAHHDADLDHDEYDDSNDYAEYVDDDQYADDEHDDEYDDDDQDADAEVDGYDDQRISEQLTGARS